MDLITVVSAVISSYTGILFLFVSWKKIVPSGLHALSVTAGWVILFFSLLLWCKFAGPEIGIVTGLCFPALLAWVVINRNAENRQARQSNRAPAKAEAATYRKITYTGRWQMLEHGARFLQVTLLSLVAGLTFNLAIVSLLDLYIETAMAFTVLMLPVSWGVAAWWCAAADRSWRPAAALACSSVFFGAIAFL